MNPSLYWSYIMGTTATMVYKTIVSKITEKHSKTYNRRMCWSRCRLSFSVTICHHVPSWILLSSPLICWSCHCHRHHEACLLCRPGCSAAL